MSQSQGNLIRQRDELIQQLQGEWDVERDKGKVNRLAFRAALLLFVSGFCLLILLYVGMYPLRKDGVDYSLGPLLLVLVPFLGFFALITYAGIQFHGYWCRRLNPLTVEGSNLVWNKRKGYVAERLSLHNLTDVIGFEGQGIASGRLLIYFMKILGGSTLDSVSPCIFVSTGDHNPPKLAPGMFKDGIQLVSTLKEIASINTQLKEFDHQTNG
tara:strand:+ start:38325 stop:38963 length:639 start_codon:yes stop_codon:yes gene_type:complete